MAGSKALASQLSLGILAVALGVAPAAQVIAGSGIDLAGFPNPAPLTADGGAQQDRAGDPVATADLNDDQVTDLVIAARMADPGGRTNAGEVYVLYGGAGLEGNYFFDASFTGPRLRGAANLDQLGTALGVGDFNGDGRDDLAVGASFAAPLGRTDAGSVYLFYGQSGSFPSVDLASQAAPVAVWGAVTGDRAGSALALQDLDGDGLAELVIGAPLANPAGRTGAGAVYILKGRANFTGSIDLAADSQQVVIQGAAEGDGLGGAVTAGDTDKDGRADLLIGAPSASPAGRTRAGKAYLIGGQSPLSGLDLSAAEADLTILSAAANDNLGASVSMGDLDGDGRADLVLGAPTAQRHGFASAGVAYGLLSKQPHAAVVDLAVETAALAVEGSAAYDFLGTWTAVADLNKDGRGDLLTGVPNAEPMGRSQAGTVLAYGGTLATGQVLPARSACLTVLGAEDGGRAGSSFAVAEMTGDTALDMIVGAPRVDSALGFDAGRTYLLPGPFVLFCSTGYLPLVLKKG
jgi:hypothetical protein